MNIAGIRCNRIAKQELSLAASLSVYFDGVYFLLDYRSPSMARSMENVISVDPRVLFKNRDVPGDWGWRCGDFCYYALNDFILDSGLSVEHVWLIESDVVFDCDVNKIFSSMDPDIDFVATQILENSTDGWYWSRFIAPFYPPEHCFFPLTRIKTALIPSLKAERSLMLDACAKNLERLPNDESFVASYIKAKGHSFLDIKKKWPEFFKKFDFNKHLVFDSLDKSLDPSVIHGAVRFSELIEQHLGNSPNVTKPIEGRLLADDQTFALEMLHLADKRAAVSGQISKTSRGGYRIFDAVEKTIAEFTANNGLVSKRILADYFNAVLMVDNERFGLLNRSMKIADERLYLIGIEWKQGVEKSFEISGPANFVEKKIFPVAFEEIDLMEYVPYCLDFKNEHVILTPYKSDFQKFPFFYQAQREFSSHILRIPFAVYNRIFKGRKDNVARLNFIFSIGRCGSTLASALAHEFGSPAYSEPDVFLNLNRKIFGVAGATLLIGLCKHFVMLCPDQSARVTIKLRAENAWLMPSIAMHVKGAKLFFLTRDLSEWHRSYASKFSRSDDALLRLLRNCFSAYKETCSKGGVVSLFKFESFSADPSQMVEEMLGFTVETGLYQRKLRGVLSKDAQAGTSIGTLEKSGGDRVKVSPDANAFVLLARRNLTQDERAFFHLTSD